jgi:hypothetical protein
MLNKIARLLITEECLRQTMLESPEDMAFGFMHLDNNENIS